MLQTVFLFLLVARFGLVSWAAGYLAYRMLQGQPEAQPGGRPRGQR